MSMLDRIKKRQLDGFKEFVHNLETSPSITRQQIFMAGILEDPIFMGWVTKNIKSFEDFLALPSQDIDRVLNQQEQMIGIIAKCLAGWTESKIQELETIIPRHFAKVRDELLYAKEVSAAQKESGIFFLLKAVRKLQASELILGFQWQLPPMDIFYPKKYGDGETQIFFESGTVAALGNIAKGKRIGFWRHYYDTGSLLAEGQYDEGYKTGLWTMFYTNGSIRGHGPYEVDLKNGVWKESDRSGGVMEIDYVAGVRKDQSSSK